MLALGRLVGVALVDAEAATQHTHAGPRALLVVLGVIASAASLVWLLEVRRPAWARMAALATMGAAGGLLASLQHGSAALAFPGVAAAQVAADGAALEAIATGALALVALEVGVVWAKLSASAALGYPGILVGSALIGITRRQYIAQGRAAQALVAQTRAAELASRRAAALDERTRIAREIHDVLAHALGGLTVQLEAAEVLLAERSDLEGALERIRGCRRTAREGLEEARRAVAALRSDAPPLAESLAGLLESHREQGSRGELILEGEPRALQPEASLALMRTVQEALTNARRHAPGSEVLVALRYDAASTRVTVTNDGAAEGPAVPEAPPAGGYGLAGMRERLELAGGRMAAGPSPEGWTVSAEVPA
ncbi:MAG: sensor histidine kinase [Solirubrobacteraceae bacterium]|jgi:signal transduction histidine kinase